MLLPSWVLAVTSLALVVAGIALPGRALATDRAEPASYGSNTHSDGLIGRVALASILLIATTSLAVLVWSMAPYSYATHGFTTPMATWAALIWACGTCSALLVVSPRRSRRPCTGAAKARPAPVPTAELVAVGAILAAGAVLRIWHIGVLPEGVWLDEIDSAADAVRLLHMPFQALAPGNFGHNLSLYFYVMAGLFKLAGTSVTVMRLTSALFGLLAIVVVYLLGRAGGGPATGLIAATFMAISPWAITFSRVAMPDIPVPAITGMGYVFLVLAMKNGRPHAFALAGVFFGLSFLTYPGAYVPGLLAVALVVWRVRSDPTFRVDSWPARALLPLGLVAGAAPALVAIVRDPDFALARVRNLSVFTEYHDLHHRLVAVLSNTRAYLLMFTVAGDNNGRHNLPGAPMLDVVTGACLLLGLGICVRRISSWYCRILLLWLAANLMSGIFSVDYEAPHGARALGALAPAVVIAALPLALFGQMVWETANGLLTRRTIMGRAGQHYADAPSAAIGWRRRSTGALAWASLAVCLPLAVACALCLHRYFVAQATNRTSWLAMGGVQSVMARAIPPLLQQGYSVTIAPGVPDDWTIASLAPGWRLQRFNPQAPVPQPLPAGGVALLIPADQRAIVDHIKQRYQVLAITRLTPGFDHGYTVAYVVRIRPFPTRARTGD